MDLLREILDFLSSITTVIPFTVVLYDYGGDYMSRSFYNPETDQIDQPSH